jgi:hypothetical protein
MHWLLFLHQIPPAPAYLRAKVMRRLNQLGAWPVKNSAYLLPLSDECVEDFEWLRTEVEQQGGEAWLFRAEAIRGLTDETIQEAFRKLRAPDFAVLIENARELLQAAVTDQTGQARRPVPLKRRYEELCRIDFFGAPGRRELEVLMSEIERTFAAPPPPPASGRTAEFNARTWVTRKGAKVDRISSAWLIRRFIDPAARFAFADPASYQYAEREVRFDMFEGEFTHDGDMCTFEVLVRFLRTDDPALTAVAEIVHDIDLKDGKFQRPETAGISMLIDGIAARHTDDLRRIEEGATIFEALYTQMQSRKRGDV